MLMLLTLMSFSTKSTEFGTSHETPDFRVEVRGGSAKLGERSVIVVSVTGKDGFEIDEGYKHAIKGKGTPGDVQWGQKKLEAVDGWLSEDGTTLTFEMPYRATRIGEYALSAKVKSRVCRGVDCKRVSKTVKTKVYVR
jgi:hypothetical protein